MDAVTRELELPPAPVPPDGLCVGARVTLRPDTPVPGESDDATRTRAARDANLQATVWGRSATNTDPWAGLRFGAGLLTQASRCCSSNPGLATLRCLEKTCCERFARSSRIRE